MRRRGAQSRRREREARLHTIKQTRSIHLGAFEAVQFSKSLIVPFLPPSHNPSSIALFALGRDIKLRPLRVAPLNVSLPVGTHARSERLSDISPVSLISATSLCLAYKSPKTRVNGLDTSISAMYRVRSTLRSTYTYIHMLRSNECAKTTAYASLKSRFACGTSTWTA